MARVSITVPRLGEGIREVRVIAILAQANQRVERDEPFAEIETDKASMVIESPAAGTVQEILCRPGDVLEVGSGLAWVATSDASSAEPSFDVKNGHSPVPAFSEDDMMPARRSQIRNAVASPREQAMARAAGSLNSWPTSSVSMTEGSLRQQLLARRLRETHLATVAASIEMELDWSALEETRRSLSNVSTPSGLELIAWATGRTIAKHPRFRSENPLRNSGATLGPVPIGIAVALPDDELVTVSVRWSEAKDLREFINEMRSAIGQAASSGVASDVSLIISDMSSFGVLTAAPAVVAPSIATLFIGYPDWKPSRSDVGGWEWRRVARLVLAFDHCLINGVGASEFLGDVIDEVGNIGLKSASFGEQQRANA